MFIWTIWFSSGCLHFQGATWDLTPPYIFGGFPWCSWQGRSGRPHYKGACRRRTRRSNYTWTVVTVVKGATLLLALLHWLWVTGFYGDILTESLVGPILTPPHLSPTPLALWPAMAQFENIILIWTPFVEIEQLAEWKRVMEGEISRVLEEIIYIFTY